MSEEIGFYTVYNHSDKISVLYNFGIYPKYRGKGLSKILLTSCLKIYKNRKIILFVSTDNHIALKLYQSVGFKQSMDFVPPQGEICMSLYNFEMNE
jgi:ribosomal protein S18 acetylase RimI-like enzyme